MLDFGDESPAVDFGNAFDLDLMGGIKMLESDASDDFDMADR